ncbi:MAG: hypothetical protein ABW252_09855, partial [Polyangiales bacterium]
MPSSGWAQARTNDAAPPVQGPSPSATAPQGDEDEEAKDQAKDSAAGASSTQPLQPATPRVVVSTGAPQPVSQNQATPLPPSAQAPAPSQAVVRVGGNMILLYNNNYAPDPDTVQGRKKHNMDAWRVGIVLDGKLDRFGMHIEFRARDRGLRWQPVGAWLEETYASADILKADNKVGPLTLKVGKIYATFGKPWDNSFYGPVAFRDGLKLDSSWGLSFEGAVAPTKPFGLRYSAQYFVLDGQTGTVATNRDTISIVQPGTSNQPIGARRRDRFVLRAEPFYKWSPTGVVRLGASFDHFTADFPDTQTPAQLARNPRIRDLDNTEKVDRYAVDLTAQIAWFGLWGEYAHQEGMHTNAFPYAPTPAAAATLAPGAAGSAATIATPAVAGLPGSGYKSADWFFVGANFTYSRFTLQYNHSQGKYNDISVNRPTQMLVGNFSQREWIHNPSIQVAVNEQIRLI